MWGLKSAGLLLSPHIPPHLRQGQNEGTLAGSAAVALPAQEEVEAYREHGTKQEALVLRGCDEGLLGRMPDGSALALFSKKDRSLGCSPSPQAGNRFENRTGTTGLRQQESPVLSSFKHSLSAYDVPRMVRVLVYGECSQM